MKFFFDNNISKRLAVGMKSFGEDVIHLKDIFPQNTVDIKWLRHIGQKKIILITRDKHIRRNPAERAAIQEYEVGAFFLGGKNLSKCKIIQQLVRNWPRIKEYAEKTRPPYAYRIPPTGTKFTKITI